ncbi:zinc finger CCCH-type with G patch domain-containing protein [Sarcophilus harrisii]|uniref:Zinc finger CCCH-type with G patch domain-containing protein n=1 Tax=Sarcophilus harrisii TaxID=9305 RepID=A0A7N4PHV0_SARHA|nr:zinc finger CCCH-type with G patch domain-containing protein [Sarcophilus harrisii]XP_012409555.1 zinc finger CCCH-type with G patch domain-containing protein [Sarcophilus harrisii]XP_031807662.1 zinc finger CCCH-type with G patch domain-containing protein [Sarcophilus harrisii]
MDENSVEASIQTYHVQLQQVELALGAGLDPTEKADLLQLQADLKQLIELTESSLVSIKKSKLLATLDPSLGLIESAVRDEAEYLAFQNAISEVTGESEIQGAERATSPERGETEPDKSGHEEEEEEELSGMKVNAPYYSSWGTLEYHNAMIVGTEQTEDGTAGVRVLYLYPTHKSLKPCPFFLEGKCRFKENCRFSHGQVVAVDELRPFQEPDLSALHTGSACLAKYDDGIWYPARITDVDSGYYTVKFDSLLLKETVVEGDGIMPPLRSEDSTLSESDGDDVDDSSYAKVMESETLEKGAWGPACSSSFAGWEAHTRGIGSKLLAQMGYEFGKGLGKNAEGRVEPIHAVVLPKGKSLDHCAEILQKRTSGKPNLGKPRKSQAKGNGVKGRPPQRNVFDFLNEKLQGKVARVQEERKVQSLKRSSKELYHASKSTKRSLSVQLFQILEKVEQTQRDIRSIQEALARNIGRHSVATAQLEEKLAGAQKELKNLRAQEAGLQREQKTAETHKKMTEF